MQPAAMPRMRTLPPLVLAVALGVAGCGGNEEPATKASPTPSPTPTTAQPATAPPGVVVPKREPIAGGPFPALFVAQAQFVEKVGADGKPLTAPGPAKLQIVRQTPSGWKST